MKIIIALPRILLGLAFGLLPLMAIFHLGPRPSMPDGAAAFVGALMKTGYMMPLVWGTEILSGILILVGLFVPFALVLLAPILVNIFLFHAFLESKGLGMAIVLCVLALVVAWQYRKAFAPLFVSGNPN